MSCGTSSDRPVVLGGIIDLRQWDFSSRGITTINGEWEFYWNSFISPALLAVSPPPEGTKMAMVPSVWNSYTTFTRFEPALGYATYHAKIFLPSEYPQLSLKIPSVGSSFICYINGEKIASSGHPGYSPDVTVPAYKPQIVSIPQGVSTCDIVFHVANFEQFYGGLWFPIEIGLSEQMFSSREKKVALEFLIVGILLLMIFYHVSMNYVRREGITTFYFATVCLVLSIRVICKDEMYMSQVFPFIDFTWLIKIDYLTISLLPPAALQFLRRFYPDEYSRGISMFFTLVSLAFAAGVLFFSPLTLSSLSFVYIPIIAVVTGYILHSLIRAVRNNRQGALILLIGTAVFSVSALNDILFVMQLIRTDYYSSFGILAIVFAESVMLSQMFAKTYQSNSDLMLELKSLNQSLEERVMARTEDVEQANKKLQDLDRLKSNFFANISHELRTPLTLILSPVEMALRGEKNDFWLNRRILESIHRNGKGLLSLINNLLELARIDAGKVSLTIEPLDLGSLLREFRETVWAAAIAKNIDIVLIAGDEPVVIFGDREKIERILINIIINAVKFTGAGGLISITLEEEEDSVRITVADNGPGIPDEMLASVFDRFNIAADDYTKGSRGSGIGLSIVKEYTELHGGTIEMATQHISYNKDDHGTSFTVRLAKGLSHFGETTARRTIVKKVEQPKKEPVVTAQSQSGMILIVEDNDELRVFIEKVLSPPHTVLHASNGKEGLEKADAFQPDLIITDVMMPVMNGRDMIRELRKKPVHQNRPVLVLSARTEEDDSPGGFSKEIDEFLLKPFDYKDLTQIVERLLRKKVLKDNPETGE